MKTLRLDRNNLNLDVIPVGLLVDSNLSLLSYDGNRFDEKAFQGKEGYEQVNISGKQKKNFVFSSYFSICNVLRLVDANLNRHELFFLSEIFLFYCRDHFSCFLNLYIYIYIVKVIHSFLNLY